MNEVLPAQSTLSYREQAKLHGERLAQQGYAALAAMNLQCIDFHCQAFHVPDAIANGPAMMSFRDLVRSTEAGLIETSVKVVDGILHPARFNLLCRPSDPAAFTAAAVACFEEMTRAEQVSLDLESIRRFTDGLEWGAVSRIFCGIDLRADRAQSRVKLWMIADDQPALASNPVQRAIATPGVNTAFYALHVHPSLLLGFDLGFDGRSALKLYPDVWETELPDAVVRERLAGVLSSRSLKIMENAYWTHFYLTSRDTEVMVDLHLSEPDDFMSKGLLHPVAQKIHAVYAGMPTLNVIAAIPQRELEQDVVENFSLYYMPAASPEPVQ